MIILTLTLALTIPACDPKVPHAVCFPSGAQHMDMPVQTVMDSMKQCKANARALKRARIVEKAVCSEEAAPAHTSAAETAPK